jgi:ADP-heptose:LPS heptosyltransferase
VGLTVPPVPPIDGLPDKYVAVKAYFGSMFPDTAENRAFLRSLIDRMSRTTNVVLLANPVAMDEHVPYEFDVRAGVHFIDHLMTARENLAVQTRVLAGASALFAPFGGFSHLSMFLGIPVFAFYSRTLFWSGTHIELAGLALDQLNNSTDGAGLMTFNSRDVARLDALRGLA